MARTTTIRVDLDTHAELMQMSKASGTSLVETVRAAAEALRRQRFAQTVSAEYAALRSDPDAWAEYLADGDLPAGDGIT